MIKFFRRIRQNLLSEGKTSKYFKYAIGEIILVVIGILIALQINNWNEGRLEVVQESKILRNLKNDFKNNRKMLDSAIVKTKEGIQFSLEMLNYTGEKNTLSHAYQFDSIINKIFITPSFNPVNGTLNEIMNSGQLVIISNEELRKLLAVWPAVMQKVYSRFEETENFENLLNNYMIKNGNWLNADEVSTAKRSMTLPKSGFKTDNRDLLNDLEFENLIENIAIGLDNYLAMLTEVNVLLKAIESLMNSEIKE
ncbi:DUF6090 family protein [Ichthyenterobacterium sp. W332]|uniref:DUF6090 family protein n=1 Tax=Microcosmobacter mediterraneus TaxID=3075607 RepID=A0ABU2YN92_9FLAO|nr:DUF6090 family protein [Ichthyenterobacterium sp. W332]MDT0559638.1 DUF6090 family protein [Ichthyenterobacterium sp. W332]